MQQPHRSSLSESGGSPHRSAKSSVKAHGQHAGVHIPWRSALESSVASSSPMVAEPATASTALVTPVSGPKRTFMVPHPVLSVI